MPSGAKKRKAAKKKKEKESNTYSSTNKTQGNDELKSQYDKGSDGGDSGEGVSPTHHEHDDDHHHPFNEGNEEVEEGNSPSSADAKTVKEVPVDIEIDEAVGGTEDGGVVIDRELKSVEDCLIKDVNVVHIKPAKQSEHENGKSGSCSNVEAVNEKDFKEEAYNTLKETVSYDELVKSIDSSHAKMTHITEDAPVEENGNSVESVKASANGDKADVLSDENDRTSSLEEPKPKEFDNNVLPHLSRCALPKSTNGTEHFKDSDTPESSENQPLVATAPRMVQKTSWLNCCGLFEVLSGSNR